MLDNELSPTEMNDKYCQPGRYSKESLQELLTLSGYEVKEIFAYYLKPFNFEQMGRLNLSEKELDALFEVGRDFEDMANMIFVRAEPR